MADPHAVGHKAPDRYEDLLATVLESVDAGVYAVNEQGLIVAVNRRGERLLARHAVDLLGQDAHDLLHRDSAGRPAPRSECAVIRAMFADRTVSQVDTWAERGDGTLLPVSSLVTPFRVGEETTGAVVVFHHRAEVEAATRDVDPATAPLSEVERLALLAETTTRLTSTLDSQEALRRLIRLVLPRLADWVVIDLVAENEEVWRTRVVHYEDGALTDREDLCGPLPPIPQDSLLPLPRALRAAVSTMSTPATYEGRLDSGLAVEQRRLFKSTGMHSAIVAPIRGPRETLGALTLGRAERSARFTNDDLALLDDITRRAGIALENARLFQRQRRVAETMQHHLLPKLPVLPGLEATVRYVSAPDASQVGGDWYDMFPLRDGSLALAVGDVVGHDLDAAAGMAQLRNMLRAHAWTQREGPGAIIRQLDDTAMHVTDVSMATVLFGRLEGSAAAGWRLRWSNAGHPPPLLIDATGNARFLDKPHGMLLGTGSSPERTDGTVDLPPRSTLVLYTDGLVEAPGRPLDEGLERLRRHAAALVHRPLEGFCDQLLKRVRSARNEDDIALLVLRVPDRPPESAAAEDDPRGSRAPDRPDGRRPA